MFLLVFGHVDADHCLFIVKKKQRECAGELRLPTPVGPRNRKLPIGRFGSFNPERRRITASETAVPLRLAQTRVQLVFEREEFLDFAFESFRRECLSSG